MSELLATLNWSAPPWQPQGDTLTLEQLQSANTAPYSVYSYYLSVLDTVLIQNGFCAAGGWGQGDFFAPSQASLTLEPHTRSALLQVSYAGDMVYSYYNALLPNDPYACRLLEAQGTGSVSLRQPFCPQATATLLDGQLAALFPGRPTACAPRLLETGESSLSWDGRCTVPDIQGGRHLHRRVLGRFVPRHRRHPGHRARPIRAPHKSRRRHPRRYLVLSARQAPMPSKCRTAALS